MNIVYISFVLFFRKDDVDPVVGIILLIGLFIFFAIKKLLDSEKDNLGAKNTNYENSFSSANSSNYLPKLNPKIPQKEFAIDLSGDTPNYKCKDGEDFTDTNFEEIISLINEQIQIKGLSLLNFQLGETAKEESNYTKFNKIFGAASKSQKVWLINDRAENYDRRRNSNVSTLISRQPIRIFENQLPYINTNIAFVTITTGSKCVSFFPQNILVFQNNRYETIPYEGQQVKIAFKQFVERDVCPSDAKVIRHTWKYLNKNGTPDQRYKSNPRIPVVLYPELILTNPRGVNLHLQISNSNLLAREQAKQNESYNQNDPPRQKQESKSTNSTSPYKILGITDQATADEVKEAYRKMASLYHPDKVATLAPEFQELAHVKMKEINAAYEAIKEGKPLSPIAVNPNEEIHIQALAIIIEMGRASTSVLQRRLSIGYGRAAKILDEFERQGYIAPADGAKPRKVLPTAYEAMKRNTVS